MKEMLSIGEQNIYLLQSLIPESDSYFLWCYNMEKDMIATSCPDDMKDMLDYLFRYYRGIDKIIEYTAKEGNRKPLLIGSSAGLQWAAVLDHNREDRMAIVIGPVFYSAPTEKSLYTALSEDSDKVKNGRFISQFIRCAPDLPVISYAVFIRYAVLLHNVLNEERLSLTDLNTWSSEAINVKASAAGSRNRTAVYKTERALLSMVRNGDINYHEAFHNAISISTGVQVHGKEPLRRTKTSVIVFTSLVCRAAMEGGLSPEIAYSLGDSYIQTVENCRDSAELGTLAHAMYQDFIYRVHQIHSNPGYSHAIQKCCDYIELSLDRNIRASDLANLVGYTEYYLTKKFRKETGVSPATYIRQAKIERAKILLDTTDMTIAAISEKLAFSTPNYFIQCFRETVGQTPGEYRHEKPIAQESTADSISSDPLKTTDWIQNRFSE